MDSRFLQEGFSAQLAHVVEECGEVLAAAGKTQRWGACSSKARLLHARNICQVLGQDCQTPSKMIFVFGSNEAGRHGAGAALFAARCRGAVYGLGYGRHGQSYAIPTKDMRIESLTLKIVKLYVGIFIHYAKNNPDLAFQVTAIGCGLAGFSNEQIAPLFVDATSNCYFDLAWEPWLPGKKFWGTF